MFPTPRRPRSPHGLKRLPGNRTSFCFTATFTAAFLACALSANAADAPLSVMPPAEAAPPAAPAASAPTSGMTPTAPAGVDDSLFPKPTYSPTALREAAALDAADRGESLPADPAAVSTPVPTEPESIYPKPIYAPTALPGAKITQAPPPVPDVPLASEHTRNAPAPKGESIRMEDVTRSATSDRAGVSGPEELTRNDPFGSATAPETVLGLVRALQRQEPDSALRRAEQVYLQYALPYPVRGMGSEGDLLAARVRALTRSGAEKQALALLNRTPEGLRKPQHLRQRAALLAVTGAMTELCAKPGEQTVGSNAPGDEIDLFCSVREGGASDPDAMTRTAEALKEQEKEDAAHFAELLAQGKTEQAKTEWLASLRDRYLSPDDQSPSATPQVRNVPEPLRKLVAALETHAGTAQEVYQKLASYRSANDDSLSNDDNLTFLNYFVTRSLKLPDTLFDALLKPSAELGSENALAMLVTFYQMRKQRAESVPPGSVTLMVKALRKSGFKLEADALAKRFAN